MLETDRAALARGTQMYPDYELDGSESPSRYRDVDSAEPLDYYALDPNLRAVLARHVGADVMAWAEERLAALGARCGGDVVRRAEVYDRVGHELERHDRFGRDVSRVIHHPDWVENRDEIFDFGLVGWNYDTALVERHGRAPVQLLTAFDYLVGQADMAICCPLELAHGAVAVLESFGTDEDVASFLQPIAATDRSRRLQVAQVATEITGGSDVGASRTEARLQDGRWVLDGEKWFASNCGADLIVTLGRVDSELPGTKGLGLFVVPRVRADGTANAISIRRLKDKLGTIGVPTGELIFNGAEAHLVGEPADGWRAMAEMLNHTRFWNAVGSLGVMRRAFVEAASYAARRRSFATTIDAFPMVRERLVWMHVDLCATTALMFECAAALEQMQTAAAAGDAAVRFRTLAPVVKYRAGEQNVDFARAAVETLGGNGYVETFATARLLRDAQVNPIWEGTSNICALDLQRAIAKQGGHEAVLGDLEARLGGIAAGPAGHLVAPAREAIAQAMAAIDALATQPTARREQQARRLADLFGDAAALAVLALEADFEAVRADFRKLLTADLFVARRAQPSDPVAAIAGGFVAVPDLYPALFGDGPLSEADHDAARATLSRPA